MPRNIEIKARIESVASVAELVKGFADSGPTEIFQDDTFFNCENGRLKLRWFGPMEGELIFYRRADESGPKESFYIRSPTTAPDYLRESLALAYGESGRVVKRRTLFLVGRTRIHLDAVEGLGEFLELEVVMSDRDIPDDAIDEAHALLSRLGIDLSDLITGAYVDLLADASKPVTQKES